LYVEVSKIHCALKVTVTHEVKIYPQYREMISGTDDNGKTVNYYFSFYKTTKINNPPRNLIYKTAQF